MPAIARSPWLVILSDPVPFPFVTVRPIPSAIALPAELRVDAWVDEEPEAELGGPSSPGITAADGTTMKAPRRTIQALAHRSRPQWGVQFHPEVCCCAGTACICAFKDELTRPVPSAEHRLNGRVRDPRRMGA